MINRVLIRIKVIQTLYSFLLVEKQFSLEGSPSAPTKEKRFAYSLYQDMLVLMVRIARSIERRNKELPLADTKFISRLLIDDSMKSLLAKYSSQPFPLQGIVDTLAGRVEESGIYKTYLKDRDREDTAAEETVWRDIFNMIIAPAPELMKVAERRDNFSLRGVERMKDMVNTTLENFLASQDNVVEVIRALDTSLDKARELYFRLLRLPVELTDLQDRIIDDNRHKFIKSEEDLNPNMRFVENTVVEAIRNNPVVNKYVADRKISWEREDPAMLRHLLHDITCSDIYREYMEGSCTDAHCDGELWRNLFKKVILDNSYFLEALEEKSVFWNDDLEIISTFAMKTFRRMEEEDTTHAVLDKFKDEEDARFGQDLLRAVFKNKETYRRYIDEALTGGNWDAERLAFMDVVVLLTAIAEIVNFPKIPLTVSINEYIELAKSYSSARSGAFVNGILGSVILRLQRDGLLYKK